MGELVEGKIWDFDFSLFGLFIDLFLVVCVRVCEMRMCNVKTHSNFSFFTFFSFLVAI